MEETNGSNSPTRLDRIERIMEVMANTRSGMRQDFAALRRTLDVVREALGRLLENWRRADQL